MASLEHRQNGRGTSYRVVWREHGEKQSETFTNQAGAVKFRQLVEGHGNQWPPGWVRGQGFAPKPQSGVPTFAEWAEKAIAARSLANDRTRADYLRDVRLHLIPVFGELRLDEITREDHVGPWLIRFRRERSPKTVGNVHALASSILNDAIASGRYGIGLNPFRGALPKQANVRTEEMVFLSRPEFDRLHASVAEHYRPLVAFLALTGLRWSEATALNVSDVEVFGRRTVTVNKAWKRQPDGTFELGEPKTRRSRRTITLPAEAVDALLPLIASRPGNARLFTSPMGYTIHHGNFRNRIWLPAVAASRLEKRPRIHDLRHTHASWLIAAGVNLVAVQRRLGHESIQTTIDRYGHLSSESDEQINAALNLGRPAGVPVDAP